MLATTADLASQGLSPVIQAKAALILEQCPTLPVFLQRVNPDVSLADKKRHHNIPTLKSINAAYRNEDAAAVWLMPRLLRLSEYIGTREKFSSTQLDMLAHDIAHTWSYINIGEIDDFLQRFRTGEFGHLFGIDDPLLILGAFREYIKKRNNDIAKEESEKKLRELDNSRRNAISWEQFCREKGINEPNPLTQLTKP